MRKVGFLVVFIISVLTLVVDAQYYYFDTGTSTYPYQQGCNEDLNVRVNTQSVGISAGLLQLLLNPLAYSYNQSNTASVLQTNTFVGSNNAFFNWTSPTGTPSWIGGSNYTLLQIDRNNGASTSNGASLLYGTLKFVPNYNSTSGSVSMVYIPGDTTKTSLSVGGVNRISTSQNSRLTGTYNFLQAPCVADTNAPSIVINTPSGTNKISYLSGISLNLNEAAGVNGVGNVPYIWTGGVWTGNPGGSISNQYGIDPTSFSLTIAGNSQSRTFTSGTYLTPNIANGKTRQFLDKNYTVFVPSAQLFDYGIEKSITMNVSVRDRLGQLTSQSIVFNAPQSPIISNRFPAPATTFVFLDSPVSFDLTDDWAGINSGTIQVTMSAVVSGGANRGPYIYTGTQINNHPNFPSTSTVTINVQVRDNANNLLNNSWSFTTRPSCGQLGCCEDKRISIKNIISDLLVNTLYISGGLNPYLTWIPGSNTGYVNCGLENDGLAIYRGDQSDSGNALFVANSIANTLQIGGSNTNNLKVILSGNTLFLSKIFDYGTLADNKGGNGSASFHKDKCPDGDNSESYYDNICEGDHNSATYCSVKDSPYSLEINDAFQYAYSIGMTTMCPIKKANLSSAITRTNLAKMLVEYAVNVVGLYPDVMKKGCEFADMTGQSSEMKFYAKLACQLDLMGLQNDGITPQKNFYPETTITRAQFGTILSRLVFGYYYNIKTGDNTSYYVNHLDALKRNDIIKLADPGIVETKAYIMLMLKRAYDSGLIDQGRFSTASKNGVKALINE